MVFRLTFQHSRLGTRWREKFHVLNSGKRCTLVNLFLHDFSPSPLSQFGVWSGLAWVVLLKFWYPFGSPATPLFSSLISLSFPPIPFVLAVPPLYQLFSSHALSLGPRQSSINFLSFIPRPQFSPIMVPILSNADDLQLPHCKLEANTPLAITDYAYTVQNSGLPSQHHVRIIINQLISVTTNP